MTTREAQLRAELKRLQQQEERLERATNDALVAQERARRARDGAARNVEEADRRLKATTVDREQTEDSILNIQRVASETRSKLESERDPRKINDLRDEIRKLQTVEDDARRHLRDLDDRVIPSSEAELKTWNEELSRQNKEFSNAVIKRQNAEDEAEKVESQIEALEVEAAKQGIKLAEADVPDVDPSTDLGLMADAPQQVAVAEESGLTDDLAAELADVAAEETTEETFVATAEPELVASAEVPAFEEIEVQTVDEMADSVEG